MVTISNNGMTLDVLDIVVVFMFGVSVRDFAGRILCYLLVDSHIDVLGEGIPHLTHFGCGINNVRHSCW